MGRIRVELAKHLKTSKEVIIQSTCIQRKIWSIVNDLVNEEIGKLKKENLQTEIQHKKKQRTTTTMHLVEKTEFVNSVKSKLVHVLENKS